MKTKMIAGQRTKIVEVAVFSGKARKPFAIVDVPEPWMLHLQAIGRRQHQSIGTMFGRALMQKIRREERALGLDSLKHAA
jgi:hypothetical protein